MHIEITPCRGIRDECPEFRIFDSDLPETDVRHVSCRRFAPALFLKFLQHSVKTDLCRIRDIGEQGVFPISFHGVKQLRNESASEGFPFLMNSGVVAAGEIDAFENAPPQRFFRQNPFKPHLCVARDDQRLSGRKFSGVGGGTVERCLNCGALGANRHDFIVEIIVTGPDSGGIADRECFAVAEDSAESVGSIEIADRARQYFSKAEIVLFLIAHLFETVADELEDQGTVLTAGGMMPRRLQNAEDFGGIGQIEISRQQKRPVKAGVFVHERMAGVETGTAERAVAEMSEIEFAAKRIMTFHPVARKGGWFVRNSFADFFQQVGKTWRMIGFFELVAGGSRFRVETDAGNSRSVLTAIVLFFQHQSQFLKSIPGGSVFAQIVIDSVTETEQRYRTFMFDLVRHRVLP